MHVRLRDCASVALLCGADASEVQKVRSLCVANADLLRRHPLYLLCFLYERRYRTWTYWFGERWADVVEIETVTKLTSPVFAGDVSVERRKALRETETLLKELYKLNLELCHCENVFSFSKELGDFVLDMVAVVESAPARWGAEPTSRQHRLELEDRIKFTIARFGAVRKRLLEVKQRLDGQINALNFVSFGRCLWNGMRC